MELLNCARSGQSLYLIDEVVGVWEVLGNVLVYIIVHGYSLVAEAAAVKTGHHW